MISSRPTVDSNGEQKSDKTRDLENDCEFRDDSNNLLNPTLWTNTIPIELLYPVNSPDYLENNKFNPTSSNLERVINNNVANGGEIGYNSVVNNGGVFKLNEQICINNDNTRHHLMTNINENDNLALNFDDYIENNFNNNHLFISDTDISSANNNFNSDILDNNTFGNYINDNNDKNNNVFNDMDISEWLKEQNNKKPNQSSPKINNNTKLDDMNFYSPNNDPNKIANSYNNDLNRFNYINQINVYPPSTSLTSPTTFTNTSNSNYYNSPLTHVLLSPSYYTNTTLHQPHPKSYISSTATEMCQTEEKKEGLVGEAKAEIQLESDEDESFEASQRPFSMDELKVTKLVPKSQKKFVPNDKKDTNYWSRRLKNNKAAKRSREAKRVKENHINLRTAFLEDENDRLKNDISKLIVENKNLKLRLAKIKR